MSYVILTDTSANLPTSILEENEIAVVPFRYYIKDKEYSCLDTEGFDGKKFYTAMRFGAKVQTSQINIFHYVRFFEPYLERGDDIRMVNMSSGISGSFHSAELAKKELMPRFPERKIRLVDALGASLGEGLLVLRALELKKRGETLESVYHTLMAERRRMCQIFTVDDLTYLRNTGRVKSSAAIVGNMLKVKPLLKGNENGEIVTAGKVIGRKRALDSLVQKYVSLVKNPEQQTIGIAHADCEEDAQYLAGQISSRIPPKEILTVMYEPVTGSHVGPGTLALFFMGGDDVRKQ